MAAAAAALGDGRRLDAAVNKGPSASSRRNVVRTLMRASISGKGGVRAGQWLGASNPTSRSVARSSPRAAFFRLSYERSPRDRRIAGGSGDSAGWTGAPSSAMMYWSARGGGTQVHRQAMRARVMVSLLVAYTSFPPLARVRPAHELLPIPGRSMLGPRAGVSSWIVGWKQSILFLFCTISSFSSALSLFSVCCSGGGVNTQLRRRPRAAIDIGDRVRPRSTRLSLQLALARRRVRHTSCMAEITRTSSRQRLATLGVDHPALLVTGPGSDQLMDSLISARRTW